jgi:hypothetical protein
LNRIPYPSPNYSSRGGSDIRLICIHTAEGSTSIESLGAFFANPASGVSSHTGIADDPNTIGEYVRRDYKAWTQANANPYTVATELCAFAAWTPADWAAHPTMLANCALWIAEEAAALGIPVVRLTAAQAQDGHSRGVCAHVDLGADGGGHWDCGPDFPMDDVIAAARGSQPTEDDLTPDQDALLRQIFNMLANGWPAHDQPPSWLVERLVSGTAQLQSSGYGALGTLDALARDTFNKVCAIEDRLAALEQ